MNEDRHYDPYKPDDRQRLTVALDLNAGDTHEYKLQKDAGAGWETD